MISVGVVSKEKEISASSREYPALIPNSLRFRRHTERYSEICQKQVLVLLVTDPNKILKLG